MLFLLYDMDVSCHRHFFLVQLLNQRWSPPLTLQASHCSTFRIMCDVPRIAVFCSESIECFPGTASKFFLIIIIIIIGQSGIESRWGRDFPPFQTGPGAHPASCKMGTGSFPGLKCGRGVLLTTHPLLVPRSWKSRAIPLPTLWATPGL